MRARLVVFIVGLGVALPPPFLGAQSTPTEREAAADILRQIDSLQAKIAPAAQAQRLVAAGGAERDRLLARVEALWTSGFRALSDHIGRNPEVGFREFKAVDTLTKVLRAAGFRVETGQAELETAFVGSWDSPAGTSGPTLGIIVEYDALRGTKEPFHGCQHNAQSPVGFATAIAIMEHMRDRRLPGRIRVFGTPAEEVGPPSKVTLWKAGVFRGTDIMVRSHGTGETARARAGFGVCCLNINEVKYIFEGRPAHQRQSWDGRNALSAAVQFYSAVDHLRPTFRPEASIQGVIPEGGVAPNVVPDRAVVDYYLRYPDEVYLAHIDSMVANAARGAALATGTKVTIDRYGEYRDGITVGSLEELVFAYARTLGAPRLVAEPQRPDGYEETGFVTREIPGVSVGVYSSPAPGHSYDRWQDSFREVGHTGFLLDAKIMTAVLYHFLHDSAFRETVKQEHAALSGWFDRYVAALRAAYAGEIR
ncbi:MAG TPA: peptidase dimerization domain-containing protein [Gemmatimonadaceae bacterium]|nr:peptidase dimerization domain-containing protein [Gemmatimonadaceae bacterium]